MKAASWGIALALAVSTAATARAEVARLVRDINRQPDAAGDSLPSGFTALANAIYFVADDGRHGPELWRVDRDSGRAELVVDLAHGAAAATRLVQITAHAGALFFLASDGDRGCGIWRSDGTAPGTAPLRIFLPGASCDRPPFAPGVLLTASGNHLFFRAGGAPQGDELWVSDGTTDGTAAIDVNPAGDSAPYALTDLHGVLLFAADSDGDGRGELWRSDGTVAGTRQVSAEPRPESRLYVLDDRVLFFARTDESRRYRLWRSDGSANGTAEVGEVQLPSDAPPELVVWRDHAYFLALDADAALALWRSDGTPEGTAPVVSGIPSVSPRSTFSRELVAAENQFFFTAQHANGVKLWRSDGTAAGTRLVTDLNPAATSGAVVDAQRLSAFGDGALFVGSAPDTGCELWRTDGTAAGTWVVVDASSSAEPCARQPDISSALVVSGIGFFRGRDDEHGMEPWITDGTAAGTHLVADVNPAAARTLDAVPLLPDTVLEDVVNERLVFAASDGEQTRLFASDGTFTGTLPLATLDPVQFIPVDGRLLVLGYGVDAANLWGTDATPQGTARLLTGDLQFLARSGAAAFFAMDPYDDFALWRSDGTAAGTMLVSDLDDPIPAPGAPPRLAESILFAVQRGETQREIWRSDGTASGTYVVSSRESFGRPGLLTQAFTRAGELAFFFGDNPETLYQLWRTDGTAAGTIDLEAPATDDDVLVVGDRLFFRGWDDAAGEEPWVSDGTRAGTHRIADLVPGELGSVPHFAMAYGGAAYFVGNRREHGWELWRSDGTAAGTRRLSDAGGLPALTLSPASPQLAPLPDALVFLAADAEHGDELWRTDGTVEGTRLIRDVERANGLRSSNRALTSVGDRIAFFADDGTHGGEPWITDGTAAGTRQLADIAPATLSSRSVDDPAPLGGFHALADRLLVMANDRSTGFELWALQDASCAGDCDGDGIVTIDELVSGVAIAVGSVATDRCSAFDTDADRRVTIAELVAAVRAALAGCAPGPAS